MRQIIKETVTGLGYELIDIERSAAGTLRIIIDWPWLGEQIKQEDIVLVDKFINTEDCEKVTRQLQFVFEVEGIDYKRLEVSSAGLDRELKTENDFWRFQNQLIDLTLKQPIALAANGVVAGNRKKFRGVLQRGEVAWQLIWTDVEEESIGKGKKKNRMPAKKKQEQVINVMDFEFSEIRDAKLVPILNFKQQPNTTK